MPITNKVMLITYPDSLGKNIEELRDVLNNDLKGAVGGIHLLPFFPSTGDRGFAPTDYTKVDPKFGDWSDVEKLGQEYYLMFDFMINHISRHSKYYEDFQQKKDKSKYADLFLSWDKFWPKGRPTKADVDLIYKRKDKAPYQEITFADGSKEKLWNTFGPEQIDLDVRKKVTQEFIKQTLNQLIEHGADIIRLDAFAYAVKKLDTNDFFVEPEIWDLLAQVRDDIAAKGAMILPEIHEHYSMPFKIAKHGYFIYDFALPMVTLYSLYSGKSERLAHWLKMCPMKQFTTLDTHDGIGVVDARDILTPEEVKYTSQELYKVGANVKKKYSSAEYHNLDIYQINTTFYSALGDDDKKYFMARLLQVFAPGIPQIYYVGMLAGKNDIKLLEETKEGRNINRHYYTREEVAEEVKRPVVASLLKLFTFRNTEAAFDLEGNIEVETPSENEIRIVRMNKDQTHKAELKANLKTLDYQVLADGKEINF
ncbi:sucrose phosphorylase [Lactobacillus amylovorus]|uniref:sucrose phosphorylase n=1 Tax=Lactobacillus amylovorus TaxID=1604 RepID=UPI00232D3040|nr:sucrose phosphorylase [Lactobacillus amylovorus]MDB6234792.1 sucrose phosphorylase [Lactobacillus amylovorus]MDB6245713.1 sucrose phosphorylase [Lactobacillus amylovorus]MDB6249621.1 sucrose phosphorylase [Lactobacillus amylovorus]MDB6257035.1 sucrose phosphorylase [Lactobacillus amylovorus]MDB6260953.1 sucrose phosphorylase [Lactobacillus amylovorus]